MVNSSLLISIKSKAAISFGIPTFQNQKFPSALSKDSQLSVMAQFP